MSGHSKWANIKHRKAAQDAKRGKVFTRVIREITVAARQGGEPADNPRLRVAIDKARAVNMGQDAIDRAIARGAGSNEGDNLEEITYEGYGPGGIAILVETMTDNRQRTVAAVRHSFSKAGGKMGTEGSVSYLFQRTGQISFPPGTDEDRIMETVLDAGAEDMVVEEDQSISVITTPASFPQVLEALQAKELTPAFAEIVMATEVSIPLNEADSEKTLRLLTNLEDLDDVQNVFHNAGLSDAALNKNQ